MTVLLSFLSFVQLNYGCSEGVAEDHLLLLPSSRPERHHVASHAHPNNVFFDNPLCDYLLDLIKADARLRVTAGVVGLEAPLLVDPSR